MRFLDQRPKAAAGALAGLVILASLACEKLVGIRETRVRPPGDARANDGDGGTEDTAAPARTDASNGPGGRNPDASVTQADATGGRGSDAGGGGSGSDAGPTNQPPPDASPVDSPGPTRDADTDAPRAPSDTGPPPVAACPPATANVQVDVFTPSNAANCSFGSYRPPEPMMYAAAVDSTLYAGSGACGACLEISNGDRRVVVQAVEHYPVSPEGGRNRISVSPGAMSRLGGGAMVQGKWRWVPCPLPASASIRAAYKGANNAFHLELIVQDFTNRLVKLEFRTSSDRSWREARRQSYNYFLNAEPKGVPTEVRLTDSYGNQEVSSSSLMWRGTTFISLGMQFPPACSY